MINESRKEIGFKIALLSTLYENNINEKLIADVARKGFCENVSFDEMLEYTTELAKKYYNDEDSNTVFLDLLSLHSQHLGFY